MPNNKKDEIGKDLENFNESSAQPLADSVYSTKVDFDKDQYSIFELKRKIEKFNEIQLDPDFQRNDRIWDNFKKSRLIESVIMGIPLPLFYFAENPTGGLSVIDGLQRITTFIDYMNNKFSLKNLTYLKDYNDKKFSDLPRNISLRIEKYQIQANVISAKTPEQVKLDIFERINSGGTPLNKQEMRNALYVGKSTRLLRKLSECDEFNKVVTVKLNKKRMRDRYIILRFISFYLWMNAAKFNIDNFKINTLLTSDLDDFFARYMRIINQLSDEQIEKIERIFKNAMMLAYQLYEENAFRRSFSNDNPFNMVMFESLSYLLSKIRDIDYSENDKNCIKNIISDIFSSISFIDSLERSLKSKSTIVLHFNYLDASLTKLERFLC